MKPSFSASASRAAGSWVSRAKTKPASPTVWSSCVRPADKDNRPKLNGKVVVIGGGNVAVDVARSALRLGADTVEMVSLEQRYEMPALPEEVAATLEENIKINNGWGPKRILGNGKVNAIELKRCTRVFDENGRFSPTYNDNETTTLKADQIIVAIGQA